MFRLRWMRKVQIGGVLLALSLTGCTLTQREERVVTATSQATVTRQVVTATLAGTIPPPPTATPQTPTVPVPSATAAPTLAASATPLPPSRTPPPTRTPSGPPTIAALDDGSGNPIMGTGSDPEPVPGIEALPASVYYLSDQNGPLQIWRLQYGLNFPEQLTFNSVDITAFDIAPDGTLTYITAAGALFNDGVQVVLPTNAGGTPPRATSVAWNPSGDWLAYTLRTPGAQDGPGGPHPVDGLVLRNWNGQTFTLASSVYADGTNADTVRVFTGPIDWHPAPNVTELLVGHDLAAGRAYSRANIASWTITPLWNAATLPPDAYSTARWSDNGTAIITSGAGRVLRVEPDTLGILQAFVAPEDGLRPQDARQFVDGTVSFVAGPANADGSGQAPGARLLYTIPPGQTAPVSAAASLTNTGRVEFLWDSAGQQTLLVVYEPPDASTGTPYLRDAGSVQHDLTPLLGPICAPQWGPLFELGDRARVNTLSGEGLRLRTAPEGELIFSMPNGTRLTIVGGPRLVGEYRWWQVRTGDRITGWAAESVRDARGLRLITLLPVD